MRSTTLLLAKSNEPFTRTRRRNSSDERVSEKFRRVWHSALREVRSRFCDAPESGLLRGLPPRTEDRKTTRTPPATCWTRQQIGWPAGQSRLRKLPESFSTRPVDGSILLRPLPSRRTPKGQMNEQPLSVGGAVGIASPSVPSAGVLRKGTHHGPPLQTHVHPPVVSGIRLHNFSAPPLPRACYNRSARRVTPVLFAGGCRQGCR
jgi:hypothetical protein